jgi:predicted transcriptional regulator
VPPKTTTVSASVEVQTARRLRALAAQESGPDKNVSVSELIRDAIDEKLEGEDLQLDEIDAAETEASA